MNSPKVRKRTWKELSERLSVETLRANKAEALLRIACAYVEAYAGRFPDNVRPEHLKRLRQGKKAKRP